MAVCLLRPGIQGQPRHKCPPTLRVPPTIAGKGKGHLHSFVFRVSCFEFFVLCDSCFGFRVSVFRVSGFGFFVFCDSYFGFRVFGFRVSCCGFQVSCFLFRVSCFGFCVLGFGFQVSCLVFCVWCFMFRVLCFVFRFSGWKALCTDDSKFRIPD